jgi:hypothetical protein
MGQLKRRNGTFETQKWDCGNAEIDIRHAEMVPLKRRNGIFEMQELDI